MEKGIKREKGLEISRKKIEYLRAGGGREQEGNIKLHDIDVLRVNAFKYLGSTGNEDGGENIEIGRRINVSWHGWRKIIDVLCDRWILRWTPVHHGTTGDTL